MNNDNAQINLKGSDITHTKTELKRGTVKAEDGGVGLRVIF